MNPLFLGKKQTVFFTRYQGGHVPHSSSWCFFFFLLFCFVASLAWHLDEVLQMSENHSHKTGKPGNRTKKREKKNRIIRTLEEGNRQRSIKEKEKGGQQQRRPKMYLNAKVKKKKKKKRT